jgi:hypothetical protein
MSAAQPLAGEGLELQSIAAVVVGGVALPGGSGSMLQAFYGVLVLGLLSNALNMVGGVILPAGVGRRHRYPTRRHRRSLAHPRGSLRTVLRHEIEHPEN